MQVAAAAALAFSGAGGPEAVGADWRPAETVEEAYTPGEPLFWPVTPLLLPGGDALSYHPEYTRIGLTDHYFAARPAGSGWLKLPGPGLAFGTPDDPIALTADRGGRVLALGAARSGFPREDSETRWSINAAALGSVSGTWTREGSSACTFPAPAVCLDQTTSRDSVAQSVSPVLASAPDGRSAAAWVWTHPGVITVRSARRSSTGTWSAAETLHRGTADTGSAAIAIDPLGNVAVTWASYDGSWWSGRVQVREWRGQSWSSTRTLTTAGSHPAIAAGANGGYVVASGSALYRRSASGTWSTIPNAFGPGGWVGMDRTGNILAAWVDATARLRSAYVPAGSQTPNLLTVTSPLDGRRAWDAVMLSTGKVVFVVHPAGGVPDRVSIIRAASAGWAAPQAIGTTDDGLVSRVRIAADPADNLLVTWAVDRPGAGVDQLEPTLQSVHARVFDQTPPIIQSLAIPSTVTVGQPMTVSATARDTLSAVSSVAWDFGDGGTGAGGTATHTYGTAGARTVTVRVRDDAGNEAVAARTLNVVSPSSAYLESGGQVVIEAEGADERISRGGRAWTATTGVTGFAGTSAMQVLPNTGGLIDTGYVTTAPQMRFRVRFRTPGTYRIWVRARAASSADNSLHAGLDNTPGTSADRLQTTALGTWQWTNATADGPGATLDVPAAGTRTLDLWMREDGLIVDRVLLTTSSTFTPTGTGPAPSPRG